MKRNVISVGIISILLLTACSQNTAIKADANATQLTQTSQSITQNKTSNKHRLIVLSDIEADPDDSQSLIRLFLYANQMDILGIVATTSVHQKTFIAPETMHMLIDKYDAVHDNLLLHEPGYPEADYFRNIVKNGLPLYGMLGVGEGKDSEGSELIIETLENDDPRPLWITVWGGVNTLAQSLYKIKHTKSAAEANRLISKLRVYTISDQDDSGAWIRKNFPDLFYIVSPGGYGSATWIAISQSIDGIDNATVSNPWLADNIQQNHGVLGAAYPDVAYGMEGDTPTFLSLIPNGLNAAENPNWGGWGGRYELYTPEYSQLDTKGFTGGVPVDAETRPIWTNATDTLNPKVANEHGRTVKALDKTFSTNQASLWRWRDDLQNDFAARMDWTIKSYAEANHPPVPVLNHNEFITVKSGQSINLNAMNSTDPDGDNLSFLWFHYPEAGSYKTPITTSMAENIYRIHFTAPEVDKPETAHFILKVTDKGTPALTRYKRIIVTITPK